MHLLVLGAFWPISQQLLIRERMVLMHLLVLGAFWLKKAGPDHSGHQLVLMHLLVRGAFWHFIKVVERLFLVVLMHLLVRGAF